MNIICVHSKENKRSFEMSEENNNVLECLVVNNEGVKCKNGSTEDNKCMYHSTARHCLNHNRERQCKNLIILGDYCYQCQNDQPSIETLINESARKMAESIYMKQGTIFRRRESPKEVSVLSKAEIKIPDGLKRPTLDGVESCVICLDCFSDGKKSTIKTLACGHKFHFDCLSGLNTLTCPMCRSEIKKSQIPRRIYESIRDNEIRAAKNLEDYHTEMARIIQRDLDAANQEIIEEDAIDYQGLDDLGLELNEEELNVLAVLTRYFLAGNANL